MEMEVRRGEHVIVSPMTLKLTFVIVRSLHNMISLPSL